VDEEEYKNKYVNLRILKNIQEYLKDEEEASTAVYPIRVPDELLFQMVKLEGVEKGDQLIHHIFRLGLTFWSEKLYQDVFGSQASLKEFIKRMKERNKE
jgi:hypothetical protein